MLDKRDRPIMFDPVEELPDIQIQHPVHFSSLDLHVEGIQRIVLPPAGPKPVGEAKEIFLVNVLHERNGCLLDQLIFQAQNAQWPQAAVCHLPSGFESVWQASACMTCCESGAGGKSALGRKPAMTSHQHRELNVASACKSCLSAVSL